jgi:O-antigen/teichoic acid export membrane protein
VAAAGTGAPRTHDVYDDPVSEAPEHVTSPPVATGASAAATGAELRKMARGSTLNLFAAVCTGIANFLLVVTITRSFSQAQAGIFFAATSLFLIVVSLGQVGTSTGMVYFVSRARSLGRVQMLGSYLRAALWPVLLAASLLGLCMFVFAPQLASLVSDGDPGELAPYLRVLGIFVPVACLAQLGLATTRGLHTMRPSAYVDHIARPVLQLILVAAVAWLAAPSLLVWAWVLPTAPAALLVWVWLRRLHARAVARVTTASSTGRPDAVTGEFWRFTAPRAVALAAQMAMQRLDIVLVAALLGPLQAAVYAATTRFLVLGQMGSQSVATAVQPRIGAAVARDDRVLACRLYGTSTAWLVLLTWPIYFTFATFGSFLLGVFGEGYSEGADALTLLSLAMLVATGCGMVDMVLNMAGRTTWTLGNTLFALVLMVGLDLWLIPAYGIIGAALGWSLARMVANLVPLALLSLVLRLHPFGVPLVTAVSASSLCFGGGLVLARVVVGESWAGLAAGAAGASLCYLALVLLLRRPLDLTALAGLRRRSRG